MGVPRCLFLFLYSPGSSGQCQQSEVNSARSESKTFPEVVLRCTNNSTWQKGARENVLFGIFTVPSYSFVALARTL